MKEDLGVNRKRVWQENFFHGLFFTSALLAVFLVAGIIFLIFSRGLEPFLPGNRFGTYRFWDFVTGIEWQPNQGDGVFGIGYMIVGSLLSTFGAILLGVPIGVLTAVFIAEVAPKPLANVMQTVVELLAAVPSVLYGVFGFAVIVPMIAEISPNVTGHSLLAVIIVLTIMVLPSIVAISTTALKSVPQVYKEGSLALGASKIQTIFKVLIPSAKSGILTSIVLGTGRAIGETMAVIMIVGNAPAMPRSILDPVRTLTTNIGLEMNYASGLHEKALFATGIVLFIIIMILNASAQYFTRKRSF